MLAPEGGNCSQPETLHKFYFSPESNKCLLFLYHGCDGNDNRFDDRMTCMKVCTGNLTEDEIRREMGILPRQIIAEGKLKRSDKILSAILNV